jgi:hypothetical protein
MATDANRERKLAVVLHADIVSSTALVYRDLSAAKQKQSFRRMR